MLAAVLLSACSRDIQNTDAVRQAVVDYLRARTAQTGLDVDLMQVDVTSVAFEHDQASATVFFRPKAGGSGMQMNYTLERNGDKWVVRGRTESVINPHGAQGLPALPQGHPPIGAAQPTGSQPTGSQP